MWSMQDDLTRNPKERGVERKKVQKGSSNECSWSEPIK